MFGTYAKPTMLLVGTKTKTGTRPRQCHTCAPLLVLLPVHSDPPALRACTAAPTLAPAATQKGCSDGFPFRLPPQGPWSPENLGGQFEGVLKGGLPRGQPGLARLQGLHQLASIACRGRRGRARGGRAPLPATRCVLLLATAGASPLLKGSRSAKQTKQATQTLQLEEQASDTGTALPLQRDVLQLFHEHSNPLPELLSEQNLPLPGYHSGNLESISE